MIALILDSKPPFPAFITLIESAIRAISRFFCMIAEVSTKNVRQKMTMTVIPPNQLDALQFCESHWPVWNQDPVSVGLTEDLVEGFKELTLTVRGDFNNAQAARLASRSATTTLKNSMATLRENASVLIATVKAFADLQVEPALVYSAAQIPMPLPTSPLPAPGRPTNIAITLEFDGAITLSWDAEDSSASSGAMFMVSRKLAGQSDYIGIGAATGSTTESRRCSFTDTTCPAAAAGTGARYVIQGVRGSRAGQPSPAMVVQFGVGGEGGSLRAAGSRATVLKRAA